MKAIKLYGLTLLLAAGLLAGCGEEYAALEESTAEQVLEGIEESVPQVRESSEEIVEESTEESREEEVVDKKYAFMTGQSVLSTGNNYRLKKVLEKAKNGETINIATLGGSVTEGALAETFHQGYAYQFRDAFEEKYGVTVNFVNAGLSGTPSSLGVMRYEQDVVDRLGTTPDLLIIEFAVNDWQECTNKRGYESLVYQALTDNEECAVILLFAVTNKDWNLQTDLMPIGSFYKLPMVSMLNALKYKTLTYEEYFADEFHPTTQGHTVMKDCLMTLLEKVEEEETNEPFEIPAEEKYGREFAHMTLIQQNTDGLDLEKGGFSATDSAVQVTHFDETASFAGSFMHTPDSGKESFRVTMECSKILFDFKETSDKSFGEAEILLDGKVVASASCYKEGGWNNNNVILVCDEQEASSHTLEVRMKKGQEDKKFTILAIAFH